MHDFLKLSQNFIDNGSFPYDSLLSLSKYKVAILIEIKLLVKIGEYFIIFEYEEKTCPPPLKPFDHHVAWKPKQVLGNPLSHRAYISFTHTVAVYQGSRFL